MPYQRLKAYNFGPAFAGQLANAGYSLTGDTAWTPAAEVLDPDGDPTGGVQATVTFPDNFAGVLLWCPDTTESPKRYAFVEVNPGDDERTDFKVSGVPAAVWSHGSRTLTSFAFQVTVAPAGLDLVVVEPVVSGGQQINARQALAVVGSAVAGRLTGEGTTTLAFAAMGNPSVGRITATISPDGRQPSLTLPS